VSWSVRLNATRGRGNRETSPCPDDALEPLGDDTPVRGRGAGLLSGNSALVLSHSSHRSLAHAVGSATSNLCSYCTRTRPLAASSELRARLAHVQSSSTRLRLADPPPRWPARSCAATFRARGRTSTSCARTRLGSPCRRSSPTTPDRLGPGRPRDLAPRRSTRSMRKMDRSRREGGHWALAPSCSGERPGSASPFSSCSAFTSRSTRAPSTVSSTRARAQRASRSSGR